MVSQDPYLWWVTLKREDNYNCRGSHQRAMGVSPTSGSLAWGSCTRKMSPQNICF